MELRVKDAIKEAPQQNKEMSLTQKLQENQVVDRCPKEPSKGSPSVIDRVVDIGIFQSIFQN